MFKGKKIFFDASFKKYYEELIDQAGKGKYKAINRLKEIEIIYNINEIKTSSDFSLFRFKCMDVNLKRENIITIIYDSFNKNIEKILLKNEMFELNKIISKLSIENSLIVSKIIDLKRTNRTNNNEAIFTSKILGRYFADYLIRNIRILIFCGPTQTTYGP